MKKKMLMAAAVLCLGLLLGAGSSMAVSYSSRGVYVIPGLIDASEPSDSSEEPEEKLVPFSASGEAGMYVMPGPFERWGHGASFAISSFIGQAFPSREEEFGLLALPYEESEKRLNELTAFCKEHKEKLNEISEYLIHAAENISDYQDEEPLLDDEELAGTFTDEKSRKILEKLKPYYLVGFDAEEGFGSFKGVSYYYPYNDDYDGEYTYPDYMVFYLKGDKENLLDFFSGRRHWITQEIDEHLFAVMESLPYV